MYNQTIDTQQQILDELKTLNSNIATNGDMQDLRSDIQTMSKEIKASIQSASVNKPLQSHNYPSIQAIEPTANMIKQSKAYTRNTRIGLGLMASGFLFAVYATAYHGGYFNNVNGLIFVGIAVLIYGFIHWKNTLSKFMMPLLDMKNTESNKHNHSGCDEQRRRDNDWYHHYSSAASSRDKFTTYPN
ncbi:hypothetical protein [uncultured Gammaproteobacteria bacterium]|uniref:hypothetical protein n=1 Tax=Bathymodiolus heckerae thiotrophic gill symbiont TaxID=1052212 RepID=UPI0010BB0A58|nr:hypothetical protein [Bathymodiolus heckerae thiotrophic gill symbiont]CAC9587960.1 hypothetical protein [uncultured Gammaproteobacteria bacterium]CAC9592876.1 hypothetical protein [uncultured Gammaproteobacteria bacterium]SHN93176.1 hypothetical protein BHECKSOX_2285 [Bathymodiolus heckerae thiotrophic gill symbiont]